MLEVYKVLTAHEDAAKLIDEPRQQPRPFKWPCVAAAIALFIFFVTRFMALLSMQRLKIRYQGYILALSLSMLSLMVVIACRNVNSSKTAPEAINGKIDLTHWDFQKDGPIKLNGEWEFYWQQHLDPEILSKPTAGQKSCFIQVPDYWNGHVINGVKLPGEGYATYRLIVLLGHAKKPLALRLMEISTAYTLFINGKILISAGLAGTSRDKTVPKWCRQVVDFEPHTDDLDIVLHVSNFHHKNGGVWEGIELGDETSIRQSQEIRIGIDLFLFGSSVIMGIYHLGLFIVRRRDRSPLYFSIFCFLIALRLLTTGERFLVRLFPFINWETLTKLEYFSYYLAVPAFCLFIKSIFPKYSKRFLNILCALAAGFSLIVLVTPARFYSQINVVYQFITFISAAYSLYVILMSTNEKPIEAYVFLLGFIMLSLMTINDMLYVDGVIKTGNWVPFGFFIFIFSQAFLLSFRFSNALATVESQDRDLRTALETMRFSEEKHRTILQSIEEGYYELDRDGNLTFFNDSLCKILGYQSEELDRMNYRKFMGPETAEQVYDTFYNVYRTGKVSKNFEWESISKDGKKVYIESSLSSILNSKGKPIGLRGVARDVTQRNKSEEQAKRHNQQLMHASKMVALGTLVSGVAHEINNPNNFIMLNSPLLKEAWENAMPILEKYYDENGDFVIGGINYSEMRENIPILFSGIAEGAKKIKQIVEDLKNYVRDDTTDLTQAVDINTVLMSAVSLISNMIKKSTNHFNADYGDNLPLLKGNFQRLEQVAINLLQNACQAIPSKDKGIFISTSYDKESSQIVFTVKDEGIGIEPEQLSQITDPFFTTRQKSGGIGLGLSISSRIIEEHGGSIKFESLPGVGTTVEVILPIYL